MALYLVTGGGGFIGSNLVAALLAQNEQVRVLDNFSTGRRANLASFLGRIEVIEGDIRSYHVVREAVTGVDYALHQSALPSVPRSVRDPITTNEVNVVGTLNVLHAAREAGVKRLVYASSSSVYGNNPELPKRESMCPNPLSPYAISKLAGEQYCQSFWRLFGFEAVCLRYFNVFGPRQNPASMYSGVISRFVDALMTDTAPIIYGDGEHSRDFTYIDNVVNANIKAMTAVKGIGETLNVANGDRITLNELLSVLKKITGKQDVQADHQEPRKGDVRDSQADNTRAVEWLGYQQKVGLEEGLRRTIDWWKASRFAK